MLYNSKYVAQICDVPLIGSNCNHVKTAFEMGFSSEKRPFEMGFQLREKTGEEQPES